ncbi:hypothetical protein ACAH01_04365 [Halomicrobium sp. HM KBTZ05]|uniref:DUF7097 family protein n=1 Tax=Halomicrobium sp. HM KBTZ05 TaxID=3242663 RepID=UPI003556F31D
MEKAPGGTSVGVDDPYAHVDRCDWITDDGKCRWAVEHGHHDPEFADARSAEEFQCPVVAGGDDHDPSVSSTEAAAGRWEWRDCPHFRRRERDRACTRCGLEERRMAHTDERPLLEEHHLSYREGSDDDLNHEITIYLCRWCHAKVHQSWARIDDDANPDAAAIAEREGRRTREQSELGFESAADRYEE